MREGPWRRRLYPVTPQTGSNDGRDVCTSGSPTRRASSFQRSCADFSYSLLPLLPRTYRSIPIAAPAPCRDLVRPSQRGSWPSANSSVVDLRSETPAVSPDVPSDGRRAVPFLAPLLPPPTAYSPSNVPASAPPSSCPSASHFAAPACSAASSRDSPLPHRIGSSCSPPPLNSTHARGC